MRNSEDLQTDNIHFRLSGRVLAEMEAHARSGSVEVCGLVYRERYVPVRNLSGSPDRYTADPSELAKALRAYGEPLAVFHTHPNGILAPSGQDHNQWYYTGSTMIIGCIRRGRFEWAVYGDPRD
jgi:proteasome lid subunit RPN8/RPN11